MGQRLYPGDTIEEMVDKKKSPVECEWIFCYGKFCNKGMDYERKIVITPFEGHYGYAGVVIAINGSPMPGTMLVKTPAIKENVPTLLGTDKEDIQAMYVLDSTDPPRLLHKHRLHIPNSKHTRLWNATISLLVERGYLVR